MLRLRAHAVTPRVAVTLIALASFVLWGVLAHEASVPRFFLDELSYIKAGSSFAQGHGLRFRGEEWGFGPLLPVLIAGLSRLTSDLEGTYELVKLANAAFFALAAIPIYLVARRLLPPWPSVGVVGLAALIPSSMYVSVVMTEALGYLLAWLAMYAIVLALERPTVGRQLVVVATTGAAILERPQFVTLYAGFLLGLVVLISASPTHRSAVRAALVSLWPTLLALAGGVAWLARPLVQGRNLGDSLGSYGALAQSYQPLSVAKWFVFELGDLALYLTVVPMMIAPIVIARLVARARDGSAPAAGFLSLFVGQNVAGVVMVAAFASTRFGLGIVYDRYIFYFVPLWLIVLAVWLREGMPRPRLQLLGGAAATVAVVAVLPFGVIGESSWFNQFEALATKVWWKVGLVAARLPVVSLRMVAVAFVLGVAAAVVLLPRRLSWMLPAAIALGLVANLGLAWRASFVDPAAYGAGPPGTRSWVDDRVGAAADVTVLYVDRTCKSAGPERFAGLLTEFFNRSVHQSFSLGGEGGAAPTSLTVRPDGRLVFRSGRAFSARYLVAQPGVVIRGRRLATGMPPGLVLWATSGAVRLEHARSDRQLLDSGCSGPP